jgi:type IV pilus biogenesis/stability protein PilW
MRSFVAILALFALVGCPTADKGARDRAVLHLQIGTGYLTSGQYPMAMAELLKAEELDPRNPLILNNLGLAFFVRGKYKQAEDKFRAAIHLQSKFSDAKNNLGRVLIETGRANEALKVLREVEGDLTYQYNEKTYSNLGLAYFSLGNYKKAEDYLSRSLEIRRQSCTTADFYGRTLLEMKRLTQAATALDQAIEFCRQEKFEEPIYFSAMSYFSLGEKEKTRARLDELIKDYPKSKYVTKAKGMLELLDQ